MTESALPAPTRSSKKALWFALHGWLALPIWGFLALVCITGTLCVISEEITWLISPEYRASKPDENASVSYPLIITSVKSRYAGADIKSIHITQSYMASLVRISLPNGEAKRLSVNQYTGEVQSEITGNGFRGFIVALHGWLLFPWEDDYSVGWYLVTALSIPLLGSIISGIMIFKHFYRLILRPKLRLSMGSRVFWGDLHRLIAAWSIWFLIIISISGLWFLVQGVLDQNQIKIYPDKIQLQPETIVENQTRIRNFSTEDLISKATNQISDLHISYIEFPEDTSDTLLIQGKKHFSILRDNVNSVNFNPQNSSLVASRDANDLSLLQWMPSLLMPLHFGDFAGLTSKIIWFLFGCLMSTLVCSGFVIWTKRTFQASKRMRSISASTTEKPLQTKNSQQQTISRQKKLKRIFFWTSWLIVIAPVYFFFQ